MCIYPESVRTDILAGLEFGVLLAREDTESVSTKVITLSLEKVSGDDLAAVTIKECKGRAEGRCGNTPEDSLSNHTSPTGLGLVNSCKEYVNLLFPFYKKKMNGSSSPCLKKSSNSKDSSLAFLL